jgi:hypothetical protein
MGIHRNTGEPATADFHLAFGMLTIVALIGLISFLRLPASAGSEVSGHHPSA